MLLERGPLLLIPSTAFPVPSASPSLVGLVAPLVGEFGAIDSALGVAAGTVATATPATFEADSAADLGLAHAELASQVGAADLSIANVGGAADTLEGTLAGLAGDTAGDLDAGMPIAPGLPRGDDLPPDYPGDEWTAWDTGTIGAYQTILGRGPTQAELVDARRYFPYFDRLEAHLRERAGAPGGGGGSPAPPTTPPPETAPPPSGGGGGHTPPAYATDDFGRAVNDLYWELLDREVDEGGLASHRGNPGGIDGVRHTILTSAEYAERHP